MNWKSTKGMTHETAPSGQCLVQYLSPRWGGWVVEFAVGYYNCGWKEWNTEKPINVIAYIVITADMGMQNPWANTTQKQIFAEHGTFTPNFGNVGI
jgi:hypothetical protein